MQQKHIEDLSEIRQMMEKASKFISLSGLSGIMAGVVALLGGIVAYWYVYLYRLDNGPFKIFGRLAGFENDVLFLLMVASVVFILALALAVLFTTRKSKKRNLPLWDHTTKKMLINMAIPLISGVFFVLALLYYNNFVFVLPATLIFYGLALINGGHFTYSDIRYLGVLQILMGFISLFLFNYAILIWCISFGVLHIVYGILMYFKYEK